MLLNARLALSALLALIACAASLQAAETPASSPNLVIGLLVPPENPAAVALAVASIAADPDGATAMGARGRRAAEEYYSWDVRARQRLSVIERAIERRTAG